MNGDEIYQKNWDTLYRQMQQLLSQYGKESAIDDSADYWIIDEPYGFDQHNVYALNFTILQPSIVQALQELLAEFPKWEIFVTVYMKRLGGENWPSMGLIIRQHEIIDGLRRQYFPLEYQNLQYQGSRPGTDRD